MNPEVLNLVQNALKISATVQNAASALLDAENSDFAKEFAEQLWKTYGPALDKVLAEMADFNESYRKELEAICGHDLFFSEDNPQSEEPADNS